jgi:polar amino acid transport system substrate-binding protein
MTCAGTIAGLITGLVLASSQPVVIGTEAPFPAYTYVDESGVISGFERDIMDQICQRQALDCSWQLANFDELIPGVMAGRFDIVLGGMAVTDDRRRLVDFTQSYSSSDSEEWYIGRPGAAPPAAALIGVQSGTVHEDHARRMGYDYKSFPTEPQVLSALVAGKVELALGPYSTRLDIQDFVDANGLDFLYSDIIPDDGVAMAVCQGNTDLLDSLNAALDAMRADGTLETLESRWFD